MQQVQDGVRAGSRGCLGGVLWRQLRWRSARASVLRRVPGLRDRQDPQAGRNQPGGPQTGRPEGSRPQEGTEVTKITFDLPSDNKVHTYCVRCSAEKVTHRPGANPGRVYRCSACGHADSRAVIIDPVVSWWLDSSQEYWHETAGVFVGDGDKFLFFERVKYPFGLTVPAGHRDKGEDPKVAGMRELREETGIVVRRLQSIATDDIWGDGCRRGADIHRWHIYAVALPSGSTVKVDSSEGSRPVWLTLKEALNRELTHAVRHIIKHHARAIQQAVA